MSRDFIEIYTDGACSGNPGPGGWGALLIFKEKKKEISGFEIATTNNRMELMAAIMALKAIKKPTPIELYTDSVYVKNGITSWIKNWEKNGWKNAQKKPIKNQELWQQLSDVSKQHDITWHWVKGHAGNEGNERADALARQAILENCIKES